MVSWKLLMYVTAFGHICSHHYASLVKQYNLVLAKKTGKVLY